MVTDTIRHVREKTYLNFYNSSNVQYSIYSENTKMLQIIFTNGGAYVYSEVPMKVYAQFSTAKSQGEALNKFIKNKYPYVKMGHYDKVKIALQMEELSKFFEEDNVLYEQELANIRQTELQSKVEQPNEEQ